MPNRFIHFIENLTHALQSRIPEWPGISRGPRQNGRIHTRLDPVYTIQDLLNGKGFLLCLVAAYPIPDDALQAFIPTFE